MRVAFIIAVILATSLIILVGSNLALGNKRIDCVLQKQYAVGDAQFLRAFGSILTPSPVEGNKVQSLINGDRIFPNLLQAIRCAKSTITMETYIYWSGSIGGKFSDEFVKAAKRGVRVKVLLDWVGGRLDDAHLKRMREAGVEIHRYIPPSW